MRLRKSLAVGVLIGVGAGVAAGPLRGRTRARTSLLGRRVRYLGGSLRGDLYHAFCRGPDPDVSDDILADRVRSRLGPVSKALDIPHVHVMVNDRVVMLHGDVADAEDALTLEETASQTAGVRGVVSMLHEGLLPSDTRPSEGIRHQQSAALRRLLAAAREAGCGPGGDRPAVRAVLTVFLEHLPVAEREHIATHLPMDVRRLTPPPRRPRTVTALPRHMDDFVQAVVNLEPVPDGKAVAVVGAVLAALRELVPEEARDVQALLPPELVELWAPASAKHEAH